MANQMGEHEPVQQKATLNVKRLIFVASSSPRFEDSNTTRK